MWKNLQRLMNSQDQKSKDTGSHEHKTKDIHTTRKGAVNPNCNSRSKVPLNVHQ